MTVGENPLNRNAKSWSGLHERYDLNFYWKVEKFIRELSDLTNQMKILRHGMILFGPCKNRLIAGSHLEPVRTAA